MGFLGKLTRKTSGFLNKAQNACKGILNKFEADKISGIGEKALNIGGKVLSGIGKTSNLLGDLGVPGVGLLGDV